MSRSLKKGPYVHFKLNKKVEKNVQENKKTVIKTWSRASMITPDFVGQTIAVHNGRQFIPHILPKIWWDTNWANFLQPDPLEVMLVLKTREKSSIKWEVEKIKWRKI